MCHYRFSWGDGRTQQSSVTHYGQFNRRQLLLSVHFLPGYSALDAVSSCVSWGRKAQRQQRRAGVDAEAHGREGRKGGGFAGTRGVLVCLRTCSQGPVVDPLHTRCTDANNRVST